MYCESKIEHNSSAHIEHIKPKSKYSHLEFEWNNLGYSCPKCNTNKSNKFDENLSFINPYDENPEEHIYFSEYFAFMKNDSNRGKYTIKELDLNRAGLIERRKDKYDKIIQMIEIASNTPSWHVQITTDLRNDAGKDKEYSAMVKCLLTIKGIM